MSNPLDTDAGTELFSSYEAELQVVQADITQKLDQIPELSGEPRKAALSQAERALEEANELVCHDQTPPPPPLSPVPARKPGLTGPCNSSTRCD
jgi:hypothetical protein